MQENELIEVFGAENLQRFGDAKSLLEKCNAIEKELEDLNSELKQAYHVDLSLSDLLVAGIGGVVCGALGGGFKSFVPKHGKLKHKHSTTRTAIDYQVPKPEGYEGNVQGLHRQIGPGHDLARFKEALDLISGKTNDFELWGKTLSEQTGGIMHPGNMPINEFLEQGGFKTPDDPKKELINHLLIDFFTKTSLPIPGTTYLVDKSEDMAKIMMGLYGNGFNLKNAVGSTGSLFLLHLIVDGYVFLLKSVPNTELLKRLGSGDCHSIKDCFRYQKKYEKSNEYNVMKMIAFGSSFTVDTIISTTSKNFTGLLELNYASLLVLVKHLIRYMLTAHKTRKGLKAERTVLFQTKTDLQLQYYQLIQEDLSDIGKSEAILSSLNPSVILSQEERVTDQVSKIDGLVQRRKELINAGNESE